MLTLSLLFEERDADGMLTTYQRYDLKTPEALYLCGTMGADDAWYENMPSDDATDLRFALIEYIREHDPDALATPAKLCPTCGAAGYDPDGELERRS